MFGWIVREFRPSRGEVCAGWVLIWGFGQALSSTDSKLTVWGTRSPLGESEAEAVLKFVDTVL